MMKRIFLCLFVLLLSGCNIQTVEHYEQQQAQIERSVAPQHEQQQQDVSTSDEVITNEATQQVTPTNTPVNDSAAPNTQQQQDIEQKKTEQALTKAEVSQAPTNTEVEQHEQLTDKQQQLKQPTSEQQDTPQQKAPTNTEAEQHEQLTDKQQQLKQPTDEQQDTPQQKATTPAQREPAAKQTVMIAIEAKTLLVPEHYAMLEKSLQQPKYVPADGIILAPTLYEIVKEGETVFDILQRAVREFNIHFEYEGADENVYNSVYIEGINHLYEFSAGNLSGWMYDVNGTAPQKGASQYVVQPNDVITWHYTVDLGKDLDGVARD